MTAIAIAERRRESVVRIINKTPDYNVLEDKAYEDTLIAAVLLNPDAFPVCAEIVQAGDFSVLWNGFMWYAFERLFSQGKAIDPVLVADELAKTESLKNHSADELIAKVVDFMAVPVTAANAELYATRVLHGAIRVRLLQASDEIAKVARDRTAGIDEIIGRADALLLTASNRIHETPSDILSISSQFYEDFETRLQGRIANTVKTGYHIFDDATGGIGRDETVVIAGAAGQGKTSFMLSMLYRMMTEGKRAFVFSLEMTRNQILTRLITMITGIPPVAFRKADLTPSQIQDYVSAIGLISDWKLNIVDDCPSLTPSQLKRRVVRLLTLNRPDIVFIDGLWLMQADEPSGNRVDDVRNITRNLVTYPKTDPQMKNIPIVVMHQYSQEVKYRKNKTPILYDLAESSSVQRDVDMILGLYRPDYHDREAESSITSLYTLKDRGAGANTGKVFDFEFKVPHFRYDEVIS